MDEKHWFIACTKAYQDKNVSVALSANGYENYIAIQKVVRKWSDRKKTISRPVLPHIVFVHCTELERRRSLEVIPYISRYMSNRQGAFHPAIVPDKEMADFMMMVDRGNGLVSVTDRPLQAGDRVRVISGPLKGMETELANVDGKDCVVVRLSMLGAATAEVDRNSVEPI